MSITANWIYGHNVVLSDPDKQTAVTVAQSSSGTVHLDAQHLRSVEGRSGLGQGPDQ